MPYLESDVIIYVTDSSSSIGENNSSNNAINVTHEVTIKNPEIKVNTPSFSLNVPYILPTVVGAAAIRAGMEIGRHVPNVGGKIIVGTGVTGLLAATAGFSSKLGSKLGSTLGSNSEENLSKVSDSNSNLNNFISLPDSLTSHVEGLDAYPLNLLTDMALINNCHLLIMIIIFNVLISIYLHDKDIINSLPTRLDPKTSIIGKLIEFAYNRYVNV